MAKLTIFEGLPASGKTTMAKEMMGKNGNTVRINKDLLRTMLHYDRFNGKNERITGETATALALSFLKQDINVISDDTNLNEKTVQRWKDIARMADARIEYVDLTHVDINECIKRDLVREKKVGKDVIINMAIRTGLFELNNIFICDLDGTLCNTGKRQHFVQGEKKDWKNFFAGISDDEVNEIVRKPLEGVAKRGANVVFVTGRSEDHKEATFAWLKKHDINWFTTLIMRGKYDSRPDEEVKRDILHTYFPDKSKIILVVDDRPKVIRMWREEGLEVDDVGKGIEF